jgi:hypothetical protein
MSYWIPPILFVLFIVMCMCAGGNSQASTEDCSIDTHRINGRYRVLYSDGYLSQPFMAETATFYASHFGGKVVPRNYDQYGKHRVRSGKWVNVPEGTAVTNEN